ncbi:hypothetical protein ACFVHS_25325 [Streptomyces sp. NPDC057746]|uniref:hypothetical protein n=1 Tax=Streptomyces sp. NPDC057746 TaxID=3346237 RepID=UPI0036CFC356
MFRDDVWTPERYGGEPLYGNLPNDYEQTARPFTVTVAGPERHGGGSPTRYVVEAFSAEKAWARALAWVMENGQSPDCLVIEDASHEGLPGGRSGIDFDDLRPEYARQRNLDDLADTATELVDQFDKATRAHVDDLGDIRPESREEYDKAVAAFRFDGWALVRQLSALDGRD